MSITIASLALLASGISLYFQFFRKKNGLVVSNLLSMRDMAAKPFATLAVSNTGNRQVLVADISFQVELNKKGVETGYAVLKTDTIDGELPRILNPSEMTLLKIHSKEDLLRCESCAFSYVDNETDQKLDEYKIWLFWTFVSSDGKRYYSMQRYGSITYKGNQLYVVDHENIQVDLFKTAHLQS